MHFASLLLLHVKCLQSIIDYTLATGLAEQLTNMVFRQTFPIQTC